MSYLKYIILFVLAGCATVPHQPMDFHSIYAGGSIPGSGGGITLIGPGASSSTPSFGSGTSIAGCTFTSTGLLSCATYTATAAASSDAFKVSNNGARFHFGTGGSDYATSDGTTVTFAGAVSMSSSLVVTGTINANNGLSIAAGRNLTMSGAASGMFFATLSNVNTAPSSPTACTSPTVSVNNGTSAFRIGVGTGCATGTATFTMPAATTGWRCSCDNRTTDRQLHCKSTSATAVSCVQYTVAGVAQNFADNDLLDCGCSGY